MFVSSMPGNSAVTSYDFSLSNTSTAGMIFRVIPPENTGSGVKSDRRKAGHEPQPKSSNMRLTSCRRPSNGGHACRVEGSIFPFFTGSEVTFSAMITSCHSNTDLVRPQRLVALTQVKHRTCDCPLGEHVCFA